MTSERDTFYLTMLASIEVAHHKGNDVLVQAMNKVTVFAPLFRASLTFIAHLFRFFCSCFPKCLMIE